MVCRKCYKPIRADEGEHPVLGVSHEIKDGERVVGSEKSFGVFHADCWEEVKQWLGDEPSAEAE